jgi:hypothetical protein
LRFRTCFRRYRRRQVPFSYFALPDPFSTVPRASGPIFMFCALELIFIGTEGIGSRFHILRSRTRFQRYRGRRDPFSCFALPNSFRAVPRLSGPVNMFCAPGLIVGGTEGVESYFHVLRSRTRFGRYRGCQIPFSCFLLPDSFSTELRVLGPVFMFCASGPVSGGTESASPNFHVSRPGLIFGGTEGVGSRFHVLRSRTRFGRYRRRRVQFLCFVLRDSFGEVPRVPSLIFMFCVLVLVFYYTEGVVPRFHFWRYRGRRIPFTCFALPDLFSTVPRSPGPVFMFCAPRLVFGSINGVGSRFHVLRSRTHFRRYQGRRIPFSYFALPDSFSAIPRVLGPVFMFCAP